MNDVFRIVPKWRPALDPEFVPAALWNRAYRERVKESGGGEPLALALERGDGGTAIFRTAILPHCGANVAVNERYVERLFKFLLWQWGGCRVVIGGNARIASYLRALYGAAGAREFDARFMGEQVYGRPFSIEGAGVDEVPCGSDATAPLGRHLEGYRIGFDLGASDRKCAAVANGEIVFSEEVPWNPSVERDPRYHFDGIDDSLRRAAAKLPRVDAIGGSAAGVYVQNEVRAASLFRAVPRDVFDSRVRRIFFDLREAWGGVPFEVVNDGEVTALAGSMALGDNAVLGIAMGSSLAAGYVTAAGEHHGVAERTGIRAGGLSRECAGGRMVGRSRSGSVIPFAAGGGALARARRASICRGRCRCPRSWSRYRR